MVIQPAPAALEWGQARARWVLTATVLGAALTFIDATVVNIALPHLAVDLDAGSEALTWVVNGYTLTLAALVLIGGALGDRFGRRRVYVVGITGFALASAACGLAPDVGTLIAARAVQGVAAALLTPGSLAILQASFTPKDRPRAIGAWSGLTGVAGAIGPFFGGWIIEVADWRWAFLVNLPIAAVVVLITRRHVPESRPPATGGKLDWTGAGLLALCLALLTFALTASSSASFLSLAVGGCLLASLVVGAVFVVFEHRSPAPLVPVRLFASRVFVFANVMTLLVYAALGVVFFSVGIVLQVGAGRSPIQAGLSLLPVTVVMLLFSSRAGALMDKAGARLPMTLGPLVAAVGVALLTRIGADVNYVLDVLVPTTVFGAGLTLMVTPLTATVLAAVPDDVVGLASGVNNAVARTGGLLAVASVPLVGGLGGKGLTDPVQVLDGFQTLMWCCVVLLVAGATLALVGVPSKREHDLSDPAARPPERHCSPAGPPVAAGSEALSGSGTPP
ncbi:MAG: family efflux transporter permease subunit [Marmoricola sp.]|jgi:EmrB/QacA subfamily drug resistance transporter|nr:family efflux transporter permease subunit [Marmoricola sp.]